MPPKKKKKKKKKKIKKELLIFLFYLLKKAFLLKLFKKRIAINTIFTDVSKDRVMIQATETFVKIYPIWSPKRDHILLFFQIKILLQVLYFLPLYLPYTQDLIFLVNL